MGALYDNRTAGRLSLRRGAMWVDAAHSLSQENWESFRRTQGASVYIVMSGGCQCGQVRYVIATPPTVVYCCHCRECQKQSASAFGMSIPVGMADVTFTGRLESWERATDLGTRTLCFFCPECGTRVYHQGTATPYQATIKGGSLDDTSRLTPSAHIWVSHKQPWVALDPALPAHPTQPDDLDAWRHGEST